MLMMSLAVRSAALYHSGWLIASSWYHDLTTHNAQNVKVPAGSYHHGELPPLSPPQHRLCCTNSRCSRTPPSSVNRSLRLGTAPAMQCQIDDEVRRRTLIPLTCWCAGCRHAAVC